MTWFDAVPALLIAGLIIFVPGALLARSCGTRGIAWAGVSAPLGISLIAIGAVVASVAGVRWSLWVLITLTLAASALALALRLVIHRFRPLTSRPEPRFGLSGNIPLASASLGGFALGAIILGVRFSKIFITPNNISQTYDNVFHLNAVRYIMDTGNGSSLSIGSIEPGVPGTFYPAAWHDFVALVAETAQASIPVSVNAVNLVIGALVWTISCFYLVTRVLGSRPAAYLVTGALAAGFSAFPYLLVFFGVLYPNFLAIALLPALIALVVDVLRLSTMSHPGSKLGLALLIGALPGLALTHPSVLMALGAFAIAPILVWLYYRIVAYRQQELSLIWLVGSSALVVFYLVALNKAWVTLRPSAAASFWPPKQTMAQAIGEAVTNAPQGRPVPYIVFALTLVGLYALVRERRHFWVICSYAISVLLFVAVSGFPKNDLRAFLTGVWYNDPYRLAAMLPVFAVPIAAYGAVWMFDSVFRYLQGHTALATDRFNFRGIVGIAGVLVAAFLVQGGAVGAAQTQATNSYRITDTSQLLSLDERALLGRVDSSIPPGAIVIANPGTGASLAYALADRRVLLPAVNSAPSADERVLFKDFGQLGQNTLICNIVTKLGANFILDFGAQEVNGGHHTFPTSAELAQSPALKLLDHEGNAKLYEITACK